MSALEGRYLKVLEELTAPLVSCGAEGGILREILRKACEVVSSDFLRVFNVTENHLKCCTEPDIIAEWGDLSIPGIVKPPEGCSQSIERIRESIKSWTGDSPIFNASGSGVLIPLFVNDSKRPSAFISCEKHSENPGWSTHDLAFLNIVGISVVLHNSLERLTNEKERLAFILKNNTNFLGIADHTGRIEFVSPPVEEMLGYLPSEVIGKSIFSFISGSERAEMERCLRTTRDTTSFSLKCMLSHKKGSTVWTSISGRVLLQAQYDSAIVFAIRNIEEEMGLRKELHKDYSLLREFEENALDVLATIDSEMNFTYVSPSSFDLSGYKPSELIDTGALRLVFEEDLELLRRKALKILHRREAGSFECRIRNKDGLPVWIETVASPILDNGKIKGWAIAARNATSRKELEFELSVRDRFASVLNELSIVILNSNSIEEAAARLLDRLSKEETFDCCRLYYFRVEPFDSILSSGKSDRFLFNLIEDGLMSDLERDDFVLREKSTEDGNIRHICVALKSGNKIFGALEGVINKPASLSANIINLYRLGATFVSVTLSKIKDLDEARRNSKAAESLRRVTEKITRNLEMDRAIEAIVQGLREVIPFYSASLEILEGNELVIVGGSWPGGQDFTGRRFTMEEGSPGADVISNRKPVLALNAQLHYPQFNLPEFHFIKSWMGAPLIIQGRPIGMIAVDSNTDGAFDSHHLELLKAFADVASIGINNARLHKEVAQLAIKDYLTEIYNRRGLYELGEKEIKKALRYNTETGIIMFDIDDFKSLNDRHGHLIGDFVLRRTAQICQTMLRSADIFGRYGGDEFIILLPMTNSAETEEAARRLRRKLSSSKIEYDGVEFTVKCSFGTATLENPGETFENMIKKADQAMYVSKNSGGNRVSSFTR
jgi:diguanylate cyclase (GGDEF)-like protein/PAS domain S-box-containing protein